MTAGTSSTKRIPMLVAFALLAAVAAVAFAILPQLFSPAETTTGSLGEVYPIQGREHIPVGASHPPYGSNPPTSGPHYERPADWGVYPQQLPDETLVHNLEHGGIWISYKDVDEETIGRLQQIAARYSVGVVVAPRAANDAKIAVASWGRLLKLDRLDENLVVAFVDANLDKAPERLAIPGQEAPVVGQIFPDFALTEVDGRAITRDSLKGKPAILWFTTSWCVPCQIGAKIVAQADNNFGGNAFNVVVIFVDPRESDADLRNWRTQFANSDWMVAFDNDIAGRVGLQYLDSKFILDQDGIVRDIDFKIADGDYLKRIAQVVTAGP